MDQFRVEDALLPGRAEAEQLIRQEPVPSQQPFVPRGFWGQIGQHFAQGTYQSLAKYFGIADKIGLTTPLTEPEFNALKGARDMPFRPGFSQQTWENEIDAHDVGYIIDQLEKRGLDNNFSMVIGSVLGGFTDPVNVAGTYLTPMVGAANLLSRGALMRLVEKAGPEAVVKYLASNPSGFMQVTKRAAIFGAAEGIAEIPADKYFSELTGQREYTVADAGLNVLTGAALNVAITGVDIGLSKAMANLQRRFKKTEAETSQFAAATSAKSINDLTPVTVSEVEANVAKMQTYQPEGKKQVVRTDGKKQATPVAVAAPPKAVKLDVPPVAHANGTPIDFKGDDVSAAMYHIANGNKTVEAAVVRALIDNGTFHADTPSTREALRKASNEVKALTDGQVPDTKAQLPKDLRGSKPRYRDLETRFESDIDKALFIVSQTKKSKRDADFRAFLHKQGMTDADIEAAAPKVRAALKELAAAGDGKGTIDLPTIHALPEGAPKAPVKVKADGQVPDTKAQLPKDLRGSKPRYRDLETRFESDIDKALFIVSQTKKSKRDADFRAFLHKQGMTDADIEAAAPKVRAALKELAAAGDGKGTIDLPTIHALPEGAPKAPVQVKADGVVKLTQVRSQLEPKADIPQTKTPDEAATVEHTVTPAPVDIAIGSQDYKALSVAAMDTHTNQIIQDMSDSGLYSPEELQFEVDNANKLASLYDELRICPTGQAEE